MFRIALALLIPALALASDNGLLYECDAATLASDNLCVFSASSTNTVGATAHVYSRDVAADGFRFVADSAGNQLSVTAKPWTQGDTLGKSSTQLSDEDANYAKIFEIVAPMRNTLMYSPGTVTKDAAAWASLTKAFTDCNVKVANEVHDGNTAYSTDNLYPIIQDPNGLGGGRTNHFVLQYLEEGAIDLVCLATSLVMDRCDTIRATNGVTTTSTCWEAAYAALGTTSTTSEDEDDDLSDGSVAGIVVGSVVGVVLIGALIVFALKGSSSAPAAAAASPAAAPQIQTRDAKIEVDSDNDYSYDSSDTSYSY